MELWRIGSSFHDVRCEIKSSFAGIKFYSLIPALAPIEDHDRTETNDFLMTTKETETKSHLCGFDSRELAGNTHRSPLTAPEPYQRTNQRNVASDPNQCRSVASGWINGRHIDVPRHCSCHPYDPSTRTVRTTTQSRSGRSRTTPQRIH